MDSKGKEKPGGKLGGKSGDKFIVEGLGGKRSLKGRIVINGAKNAVLKAIAAAVLFEDGLTIENVPSTKDVDTLIELMLKLDIEVKKINTGKTLYIKAPQELTNHELDFTLASAMRASMVLTGPLIARYGSLTFPAPGGCVIGSRPIDLTIEGYRKLGANVSLAENNDRYIVTAKKELSGAEIFFPIQTVGGTETLMMTAILASGTTVLKNCAMEPEITSLAEFLVSCGAKIRGIGTTTLTISGTGGTLLRSTGKTYKTIPDRIEAGSFLLLGALTSDNLLIDNCEPQHLESVTNFLDTVGVKLEIKKSSVKILGPKNSERGLAVPPGFHIRTHEYPGFPTDLQAQVVAFLTQVRGESLVFETIYEGRFKYVDDLIRMGADIKVLNSREVMIRNQFKIKQLKALSENNTENKELVAHDIRAGFAVVMAALVATGRSVINNVRLIDRGYEALEERLGGIGAKIQRK